MASFGQIRSLADAGQVATQYVDLNGEPTMEYPHNPNGSRFAVEGITSPDGRVLGKMGHNERLTPGLAVNIPDLREPELFRGGVNYFR